MKNNIDVFYFSTLYPLHILFVEDGKMGRLRDVCEREREAGSRRLGTRGRGTWRRYVGKYCSIP